MLFLPFPGCSSLGVIFLPPEPGRVGSPQRGSLLMPLEALAGSEATTGPRDRGQAHMEPASLTERPQEGHHTQTLSSYFDDIRTPEPFLAGAVLTVSSQEGKSPKEGLGTVPYHKMSSLGPSM